MLLDARLELEKEDGGEGELDRFYTLEKLRTLSTNERERLGRSIGSSSLPSITVFSVFSFSFSLSTPTTRTWGGKNSCVGLVTAALVDAEEH